MEANTRMLLERCIEEGIAHGHRRAYKHTDTPSEDGFRNEIANAIWLEIDTYFTFDHG